MERLVQATGSTGSAVSNRDNHGLATMPKLRPVTQVDGRVYKLYRSRMPRAATIPCSIAPSINPLQPFAQSALAKNILPCGA